MQFFFLIFLEGVGEDFVFVFARWGRGCVFVVEGSKCRLYWRYHMGLRFRAKQPHKPRRKACF